MNKAIVMSVALMGACATSLRAGIDTVYMHEGKVQVVPLRLSNSTVFRFGAKPSNVIIGNSNYFQAEFVGNDVSVQPVAEGTTNMFVYSAGRLFTFRLNAYFERPGQDLLIVKHLPKGAKRLKPKRSKQKSLRLTSTSKELKVTATKLVSAGGRKIIEFKAHNLAGKKLRKKDVYLSFYRRKKEIVPLEVEWRKHSKSTLYFRVAFPSHVKPFSVKMKANEASLRLVVSRRSLWIK